MVGDDDKKRRPRSQTEPGAGGTQDIVMDFGRPARSRSAPVAPAPFAEPFRPMTPGRVPTSPGAAGPGGHRSMPAGPAPARPGVPAPGGFGDRSSTVMHPSASAADPLRTGTQGFARTGAATQGFPATGAFAPSGGLAHTGEVTSAMARRHGPTPEEADRERRAVISRRSRDFLIHIDTLSRLLAIHDARNQAVQAALRELVDDLEALQRGGEELSLVFAEGHAFVNGVWVRASRRAWDAAVLLTERLGQIEGRGIVLDADTRADTLLALTDFLRQDRPAGVTAQEHFDRAGLPGIKLVPMPSAADRARGAAEGRQDALKLFTEGLEAVTEHDLADLDLFMRRRQRALVQSLVQLAENEPENLLSLTVMRDPTLGPRAHSLMVAIYSVAVGRMMDFGRRDLLRLGVAALNHNLGEALLPAEVFSIERKLQPHERGTIEEHPLRGFAHLLQHYGFGQGTLERALTSAEHHQRFDGQGGYPFPAAAGQHPFSRIIAVADVFDALCQPRPWRGAFPPDQAVKLVSRQAGKQLDDVIVRRFVWLVGRYPPGSLVELDTGEWGLVLGPGHGLYPLIRPRVLLISDADGWEMETPIAVDLGERHPRRRAWLRTIARTRDPNKVGLPVARYFFGERIEGRPGRMDSDELGA